MIFGEAYMWLVAIYACAVVLGAITSMVCEHDL
jgi:hypothetical protein